MYYYDSEDIALTNRDNIALTNRDSQPHEKYILAENVSEIC